MCRLHHHDPTTRIIPDSAAQQKQNGHARLATVRQMP